MTEIKADIEYIDVDADPINKNWLRLIRAAKENRPDDIVRLSGGHYTLDDAYRIIQEQQEQDKEVERREARAKPFGDYPEEGRALLGTVGNGTCRHGYGLRFMHKIGQTTCAYCGLDFAASYRNWLQMALDHVVPTRTGAAKGVRAEWLDDASNKVLACGTCNGFQNRYKITDAEVCPTSLKEFYELRDRVFTERKALVEKSHIREHAFFDQKPWVLI